MTIQCVFASLSGPAIDLQKMLDGKKKISFSKETHFDQKSNIVAFGAQKTRTHTLKSRRTQNESLFGSDFSAFFFKNEQGEAVTVNGDHSRAMLNEFMFPKIED